MIVHGANQLIRNGTAKQYAKDLVFSRISVIFIESDQDERSLHEVFVLEEWGEEAFAELSGNSHGCVVAVVGHIWRNEHPLGKLFGLQVLIEHCQVLLERKTLRACVSVVQDRRIVFPCVC